MIDLTRKANNTQQRTISISLVESISESNILETVVLAELPKDAQLVTTQVVVQESSGTSGATVSIKVGTFEVKEFTVDTPGYLVDLSRYTFAIGGTLTVEAGSVAPAAGDLVIDVVIEYIETQKTTGDMTRLYEGS